MSLLTKEERYEIDRLAKRARGGLYKAEKQALNFISEAQTMQDGVCRKALKACEDLGYGVREVQWGIHGKWRKGKLEFPGLISRGIVSASGFLKGGRAPGGKGLIPTYTINRDLLLKFIPEIDDDTNGDTKGETLGETYPETSPKKGETYPDLMRTSSCSSSLRSSPQHNGPSVVGRRVQEASEGDVVVVGNGGENQNQKRGQENPERDEEIIATSRRRQLERKTPQAEIIREFESVFNRLKADAEKPYADWIFPKNNLSGQDFAFKTSASHRKEATALYRRIGRDEVLVKWRDFLLNDDHLASERGSGEVPRTWLLRDFLDKYSDATPAIPHVESVRDES